MTIPRVRYREQQTLGYQDLSDEQAYHVAMRRRHAMLNHLWGIVGGLGVTADTKGLWIERGIAIDGYGRELILPARAQISDAVLRDNKVFASGEGVGVWLLYGRVPEFLPGRGRWDRGADHENRWREVAMVRLKSVDQTGSIAPPGDTGQPAVSRW